jgi:hypothetical protein
MENSASFIETWDSYLITGSYLFFGLTLLIILLYEVKVLMISDPKNRYDYVNLHEIKFFRYGVITFIIGMALYLVGKVTPKLPVSDSLKIFISAFFLIVIVTIAYVTLSSVLQVIYPRLLEGRLNRIRNKARKSSTGNTMRKLSSEEGSVHLEADQLAQHQSVIHSVEYDVWLDDTTGEKKIEKYMGYQHAEKCNECGYFTMSINSEEIEKQPTQQEDGLLLKHYKCSYCNHREAREVVIASLGNNT